MDTNILKIKMYFFIKHSGSIYKYLQFLIGKTQRLSESTGTAYLRLIDDVPTDHHLINFQSKLILPMILMPIMRNVLSCWYSCQESSQVS